MAAVHAGAWANPSSLHGFGLAAAEQLERSRQRIGELLGCASHQVLFTSGGSESIHTARLGLVDQQLLEQLLVPPTRLVSLIWGQSEVGTIQPLQAIGSKCRASGVLLHVDAVQVIGHQQLDFNALPVDLLSLAGHKLQGPRGIGALLLRPDLQLSPLIGGGGQEAGRRGGTEPVALVAGLARALELCTDRLVAHGGSDPVGPLRNALLEQLLQLEGVRLSGPDPRDLEAPERLPHHLSLLLAGPDGQPLSGRRLVRNLWQQGYAVGSGSACSSGQAASPAGQTPSPILLAMGYTSEVAASGLRFSLGPWHRGSDLAGVGAALERARQPSPPRVI